MLRQVRPIHSARIESALDHTRSLAEMAEATRSRAWPTPGHQRDSFIPADPGWISVPAPVRASWPWPDGVIESVLATPDNRPRTTNVILPVNRSTSRQLSALCEPWRATIMSLHSREARRVPARNRAHGRSTSHDALERRRHSNSWVSGVVRIRWASSLSSSRPGPIMPGICQSASRFSLSSAPRHGTGLDATTRDLERRHVRFTRFEGTKTGWKPGTRG